MSTRPAANAVATGAQPGGLAADEPDRLGLDPAELDQLLEALRELREHRARRDRGDDDVGQPPAELLGDLEAERLAALGVERAEVDVDEPPPQLVGDLEAQPVDVVVGAVDPDDGRAVGERVLDLGGLEVGGDEHEGRDADRPRRPRPSRRRGCRWSRRRAPRGRTSRPGRGDRDGPVLERERRVAGVVLDQQPFDADRRAEPVRARPAAWSRPASPRSGGGVDGEQLEVAPDARSPGRDRVAG